MAVVSPRALRVLNEFVHDFASGYWLAVVLVIWQLHGLDGSLTGGPLQSVERRFFWHAVAAVGVIFTTGGLRAALYPPDKYGADAETIRRRILIIKHVVLFVVLGVGCWWAHRMAFHA